MDTLGNVPAQTTTEQTDHASALESVSIQIARYARLTTRLEAIVDRIVGPSPQPVDSAPDSSEPLAYADRIRARAADMENISNRLESDIDRLCKF